MGTAELNRLDLSSIHQPQLQCLAQQELTSAVLRMQRLLGAQVSCVKVMGHGVLRTILCVSVDQDM